MKLSKTFMNIYCYFSVPFTDRISSIDFGGIISDDAVSKAKIYVGCISCLSLEQGLSISSQL